MKDAIAPTVFAFKNSRCFQMGGLYGAMSFLSITASDLSDQLLKDFLEMDSSQIVTMHIQSWTRTRPSRRSSAPSPNSIDRRSRNRKKQSAPDMIWT